MNKIVRNEKHKYTINGNPAIGVNELLELFGMKRHIPEHLLSYTRYKGTKVHKAIELYLADDLDEESLDEKLLPYLKGFKKFYNAMCEKPEGFEIFETEQFVGSEALGICGQYDCLVNQEGHRIFDWTTSERIHDSKWIQVALYKYLYELESEFNKIEGIHIVSILPDDYKIHQPPQDWSPDEMANYLIMLYSWRKRRNLIN